MGTDPLPRLLLLENVAVKCLLVGLWIWMIPKILLPLLAQRKARRPPRAKPLRSRHQPHQRKTPQITYKKKWIKHTLQTPLILYLEISSEVNEPFTLVRNPVLPTTFKQKKIFILPDCKISTSN